MAKAQRWYEEVYGDQLKHDFAYGFVPVKLANAVWRVRASVTYGTVSLFIDKNLSNRGINLGAHGAKASYNVLCAIEKLPQGLADKLSDTALQEHMEFHVFMHNNLNGEVSFLGPNSWKWLGLTMILLPQMYLRFAMGKPVGPLSRQ